jgi:hypothetical protein
MPLTTRRQALAQLAFCRGCCCGRTDRGRPEVPVERLKQIWAAEKLNRTVQLTISGCLGPCDAESTVRATATAFHLTVKWIAGPGAHRERAPKVVEA